MSFDSALKFTLQWEGGYSNHPADKGGETNFGITHATYDTYRRSLGLPRRSVRLIEMDEVKSIYKLHYWQPSGCELLPPYLALCQFDWAVNAGIYRAIKTLQQVVGSQPDGIIGPNTKSALVTALNSRGEKSLASSYLIIRENSYRHWASGRQHVFLAGWLNRLAAIKRAIA